jgi:hypothetical protein
MNETMCPMCDGEVSGVATPKGLRRKRHQPAPDTSTGYCMACHIGLSKSDGAWSRSSVNLSP